MKAAYNNKKKRNRNPKMKSKIVIDGNAIYELDEECLRQKAEEEKEKQKQGEEKETK